MYQDILKDALSDAKIARGAYAKTLLSLIIACQRGPQSGRIIKYKCELLKGLKYQKLTVFDDAEKQDLSLLRSQHWKVIFGAIGGLP